MKPTLPSAIAVSSILLATISASSGAIVFATLNSQDRIVGERQTDSPPLGYQVSTTGTLQVGVGGATNARTNYNTVVGFLLPTLSPGQTIDAATFSATIESESGTVTVSLFGLSTTNPDVTGISLFSESNSGPGLIAAAFTSTTAAAAGDTPSADVLSFINSLYTGHVPTQPEVFFRLNPSSNLGTSVARMNFTNGSPKLALNVVPEPSAALLGGLGVLALLRRRR